MDQYPDQSMEGEENVIPGTMWSLLNSHVEGNGRKSLLAHYFPGDSLHQLESIASSSQIAWQATKGQSLCKDLLTHQEWANWCGATTMGALADFPRDPDGLCIHMRLQSGKVYAIFKDTSPLSELHEGLVLEPNTRLYEEFFLSTFIHR